ncbi:MAG: nucleoside monophosphate kinase [Verrucomicrobiota bacterium]
MSPRNDRATWIQGDAASCSISPNPRLRPPRIVLLGAPGIGKGTQAELLCSGLGICHLATSEVFRAAQCLPDAAQTLGMKEAIECLKHGGHVSDSIVLQLIHERKKCLRCHGGFLLDGFPRTVPQARVLDEFLDQEEIRLDAVLNYTLPIQTIIQRLAQRRVCQECNAVFHLTAQPPKVADVCDYCGGVLMQREDDLPAAIHARMLAYEKGTKPLIDYYLQHGLIRTISAEGLPERIYERALAILDP